MDEDNISTMNLQDQLLKTIISSSIEKLYKKEIDNHDEEVRSTRGKKNIIKKKENNKEEKILKERIEFENAFNEVLIETKLQTQKEKSSLKL